MILDNKVNEVRAWNNTPYKFLLRQSSVDPRAWTSLAPARDLAPLPIAVLRQHNSPPAPSAQRFSAIHLAGARACGKDSFELEPLRYLSR